jgi:micrococcal nuclease
MLVVGLTFGAASQLHLFKGEAATAPPDHALSDRLSTNDAVRVIDGDTFDFAGERIRIADIDTPELRGACAEEQRLARAATERLRTLLGAGPFELRRLGRDEDRYGRKLRVVVRSGRSLGDVLVSEGLARTWTGRREPWC